MGAEDRRDRFIRQYARGKSFVDAGGLEANEKESGTLGLIENCFCPPPLEAETRISYSQNAEDIRLWRVFGKVDHGFYVDIGAADPSVGSVSRIFYDHGWSGVNVEPSPTFDALAALRERDVNLPIAIGESEGPSPFFLTYPDLGLSTGDPSFRAGVSGTIERIEEITVLKRRLESVLRDNADAKTIHFLKVDAEGAEREVLASSDWNAFRPIVVLVEAIKPWSTTPTHEAWEHILLDAEYGFAAFDGINRFYVDRDHHDLIPALAYPISALDRFMTATVYDQLVAANERVREADSRVGEADGRVLRSEATSERLGRSLEEAHAELAAARHECERLGRSLAEVEQASQSLETVYRSRTWRAGKLIAAAGKPVLRLARVGRRPEPPQRGVGGRGA